MHDIHDSAHEQAERTIPRGSHAGDGDRRPAVDRAVWLDHVRLAGAPDAATLDRLVREYERYARSLAVRLHRGHEAIEDLEQIALEALIVALRRFDPERGIPFPAFATPTILGALRRHYRDSGWLIRVPRRIHEFAVAQRDAVDRLTLRLHRPPTTAELAGELGLSVDEVLDCQDALHARDARSLDAPSDDALALSERVGEEDRDLDRSIDRVAAASAIRTLPEGDRDLLRLYFVEEQTQSEVAEVLGVSQMQVSRLLSSALRRLQQLAATA